MTIFLCTYDLNHEVRRPPIVAEIKRVGTWAMLSESSYAIETSEFVGDIYDRFKKLLDRDDYFLAIPLRAPYAGQNDADVIQWLNAKLRR